MEATKKNLPTLNDEGTATPTPYAERLYKLLHGLNALDSSTLRSTVNSFVDIEERDVNQGSLAAPSREDERAKLALESRVLVGVYAEVLGRWLQEASEADAEAELEDERSGPNESQRIHTKELGQVSVWDGPTPMVMRGAGRRLRPPLYSRCNL